MTGETPQPREFFNIYVATLDQRLILRSATKYFKNYKLDYPNTETQKGSRKFVKAMKKLHVCSTVYVLPCVRMLTFAGNHPTSHRVQQEVP